MYGQNAMFPLITEAYVPILQLSPIFIFSYAFFTLYFNLHILGANLSSNMATLVPGIWLVGESQLFSKMNMYIDSNFMF